MFDKKRVEGTLSVLNTKNRPKQKELCSKKYKKQSLSDQILSFCQTFAPTQSDHCCRSYSYNKCYNKQQIKECQNKWQTQKVEEKQICCQSFFFSGSPKRFLVCFGFDFLFHHLQQWIVCFSSSKIKQKNRTEKQINKKE